MYTNADCTVFNKRYNRETRTDTWSRTYIRGVFWESSESVASDRTTGITDDSNLFVAIPADADTEGKSYCKPNEYKVASPEAAFTLAPEDVIVKGIIPENIGDGVTVKELQQKYDCFYVITKCSDLRFGGHPHLEVNGK